MNNPIQTLISQYDIQTHPHLLEEAIDTLLKMWQKHPHSQDLKLAATSLDELYHSFKVFGAFKDARKVCIFGSARTQLDDPDYELTAEFAHKITQQGFFVLTGAGGGIMEAGNKGAGTNKSFGLNIALPFEQHVNPYIVDSPKLITYKYFFLRKLMFIKESDATVLMPGGFGTHDEAFETLTLLQNGRCAPRPMVCLARPNSTYWESWLDFVNQELLAPNYISSDDLKLFTITHDADQAVQTILHFYKTYHSIRYLENYTVMRLNQDISPKCLETISAEFSDILLDGKFTQTDVNSIPEERDIFHAKPRLTFRFNQLHYGRLYALILYLNKHGQDH